MGNIKGILVVDDDPSIRTIVALTLEKIGYQYFTAKNREEALAFFKENSEDICAIITDCRMPGIGDGHILIAEIRKINKDVRFMMISGDLDVVVPEDTDFIQKPFLQEELIMKVKIMISKKNFNFARISKGFCIDMDTMLLNLVNENEAEGILLQVVESIKKGGEDRICAIRFIFSFYRQPGWAYKQTFEEKMVKYGLSAVLEKINEICCKDLVIA